MSTTTIEPAERLAPKMPQGFHVPVTRNYAVIASIWPRPLIREESHYQPKIDEHGRQVAVPHTIYRLEAGARSMTEAAAGVQLLKVYDTYMVREIPETKRPEKMPLEARDVAEGLVSVLTGVKGGARSRRAPGVMVLEGEEPTQEELQAMIVSQSTYLQRMCARAEENYRSGQMQLIGDAERMAATWLNQQTRYEWVPLGELGSTKTCISCGGSLPVNALACNNAGCGDLVDKVQKGYFTMAEVKALDPFLHDRVKLIQQRAADRERKAKSGGSQDDE